MPEGQESDAPAADREELRDRLAAALAAGDRETLERLAIEAVDGFGGWGSPLVERSRDLGGGSSPGSDGWSSYQTLDRLRPQTLMARVRDSVRARQDGAAGFTDRLLEDEIRRRIEMFRALVATEARRRVAERRGRDELARRAVAPTADRVDFLFAGRDRLAELRRTVPMRPVLRRRRPVRPELVLLCDVSGSVAGFSDFTMLLVQALHDQFSKVRVFAFVNRIDEVTGLLVHGAADPEGLGARIRSEATLTGWHGSSDYGVAFGEFAERYVEAVGPRTTVFVLGDARTNMGDPNLPAVRRFSERARRVYWLNPEPLSQWGTGDSAAPEYAGLVEMHECRNVGQLSGLIGRLLPV
jgi:uncharacterized protein with von Willebrand factor type A (vWA) domain